MPHVTHHAQPGPDPHCLPPLTPPPSPDNPDVTPFSLLFSLVLIFRRDDEADGELLDSDATLDATQNSKRYALKFLIKD